MSYVSTGIEGLFVALVITGLAVFLILLAVTNGASPEKKKGSTAVEPKFETPNQRRSS